MKTESCYNTHLYQYIYKKTNNAILIPLLLLPLPLPLLQLQVWYHKCNSKGKNCENRKLTDEGGCCIWYDESDLIGHVESRLDSLIPSMSNGKISSGSGSGSDDKFELPEIIKAQGIVYGETIQSGKYKRV